MESAGPTGSPPETSRREARVEHHRLDPTRPETRDPDPHPGPVHQVSVYQCKVWVLARRLQFWLGSGTVQFCLFINLSFCHPFSRMYLRIIISPANVVSLCHRLASLAWQVHSV